MASWLQEHLPQDARILVSPALRTQQTARALTHEFETHADLAPDGSYAGILSLARWPEDNGAVLVVGHQPALGQIAALLLSGEPAMWTIKKGALFWLTHRVRGEAQQVVLRAALSPEFL